MTSHVRGRVELVSVGQAATFEVRGRTLHSAIRKRPQAKAVEVTVAGLVGDEVADRKHHGGPNRAVHCFAAEHYDLFAARLDEPVAPPWVGENITVRGYPDELARAGDVVRVGSAVLQVTMPTERCGHPGRVTGIRELRNWMVEELRTGFYLRVLEPGRIAPGDAIEVLEQGDEMWTVAALSAVMYRELTDARRVAEVAKADSVANEYKARLRLLHERKAKSAPH